MSEEKYIIAMLVVSEKQTYAFLPLFFFHPPWSSFQRNTHTPLPLLKEVYFLYFLLLQVMMDVDISLLSETAGFLNTHFGSLFVYFLDGLPLDPVTFDLQSFWV